MENWAGSEASALVCGGRRGDGKAYINCFWSMRYFLLQDIFSLVRFCLFVCLSYCMPCSYELLLSQTHIYLYERMSGT